MKFNKLKFILPILGIGVISTSIGITITSCSSNKNNSQTANIINRENLQDNFPKLSTKELQDLIFSSQRQNGKLQPNNAKAFLKNMNAISKQDISKVYSVFLTIDNKSTKESNFQTLKFKLKVVFDNNKIETISNIESRINIINFNQTNFTNGLKTLSKSKLSDLKNINIDELKDKIISFNCGFRNIDQIQTINIDKKTLSKQTKENTNFDLTFSIEVSNENIIYIDDEYKPNITLDFTINNDSIAYSTQIVNVTENDLNSIINLFNSTFSYENVFNINSEDDFDNKLLELYTSASSSLIIDDSSFKDAIKSVHFSKTSDNSNEFNGYIKGMLKFTTKSKYNFLTKNLNEVSTFNTPIFETDIYNPNSDYNIDLFITNRTSGGQYEIVNSKYLVDKVYIPSNIDGDDVVGVGDNINGVFIPENIVVVLPPTIDRIASYAFKDSNIEKIICLSNKENFQICNNVFENIRSTSITIDLSFLDNINKNTLSDNVFQGLPKNVSFTFIVKTNAIKTMLKQRINSLSNHPTKFTINTIE